MSQEVFEGREYKEHNSRGTGISRPDAAGDAGVRDASRRRRGAIWLLAMFAGMMFLLHALVILVSMVVQIEVCKSGGTFVVTGGGVIGLLPNTWYGNPVQVRVSMGNLGGWVRWPDWKAIPPYVYIVCIPLWPTAVVTGGVGLVLGPRLARSAHGCCRRCGYNLFGNESGICPECGVRIGRR